MLAAQLEEGGEGSLIGTEVKNFETNHKKIHVHILDSIFWVWFKLLVPLRVTNADSFITR